MKTLINLTAAIMLAMCTHLAVAQQAGDPALASSVKDTAHQLADSSLTPKTTIKLESRPKKEKQGRRHNTGGDLIPILAIILVFVSPAMIITVILIAWHFRQKRRIELIEKFVETGQAIPEQLLNHRSKENQDQPTSLRNGLLFAGAGVGLAVFGYLTHASIMAFAAVPFFIGLAYLLLSKLETPKQAG